MRWKIELCLCWFSFASGCESHRQYNDPCLLYHPLIEFKLPGVEKHWLRWASNLRLWERVARNHASFYFSVLLIFEQHNPNQTELKQVNLNRFSWVDTVIFFLKLKCVHQLLSLPSISRHKTCWNLKNLICFSDHLIWSNEKKILETILIIFSTEISATFPAQLLNQDEEDEHDCST